MEQSCRPTDELTEIHQVGLIEINALFGDGRIMDAHPRRCVGKVISNVCEFVSVYVCDCVCVCLSVRALKRNQIQLSVWSTAGLRHALTLRSKGQSQGHAVITYYDLLRHKAAKITQIHAINTLLAYFSPKI